MDNRPKREGISSKVSRGKHENSTVTLVRVKEDFLHRIQKALSIKEKIIGFHQNQKLLIKRGI